MDVATARCAPSPHSTKHCSERSTAPSSISTGCAIAVSGELVFSYAERILAQTIGIVDLALPHGDLRLVRADEARWCAMLSRQIRRLGGTPSRKCGAFRGKAMAIADPIERLAFLNRGQAWVVRKLVELMRRVRDDALHADLRAGQPTQEILHEPADVARQGHAPGDGPAYRHPARG